MPNRLGPDNNDYEFNGGEKVSSVPLDQPENPVDKIVSQVKDVAVLPQVVFKIMETTGNTETSPAELERDIIVDPGFSAKVLAMANSAHFALPKRVTSIRDAIAFLGLKQVRQLAMHAGVFDLFVGKTDKESLRRRAWWRHSLDTAVCAKWMASQLRGLNPEEAYAAGLLHLIGKTIMDRSDPEMYSMVMMASEKAVPTLIAEKHFFGCNHVAVGAAICAKWNLPPELVEAVAYAEETDSEQADLRACIAIGHTIAELATHGVQGDRPVQDYFYKWAVDRLNIADTLPQWLDAGVQIVGQAQGAAA